MNNIDGTQEPPVSREIDLVEEHADTVYAGGAVRPSNGWARLSIDMTLMAEEDRSKVYYAQQLLREAGICFDSGSGEGGRDWELDWSLTGATIQIRPLTCLACQGPDVTLWAYWLTQTGHVLSYPYCNPTCLETDKKGRDAWRLLVTESMT